MPLRAQARVIAEPRAKGPGVQVLAWVEWTQAEQWAVARLG